MDADNDHEALSASHSTVSGSTDDKLQALPSASEPAYTDQKTFKRSLSNLRPPEVSSEERKWSCQACGFANAMYTRECIMCLTLSGSNAFRVPQSMIGVGVPPDPPFRECVKCLHRARNTRFLPCGHAIVCSQCMPSYRRIKGVCWWVA